jgi:uncharacterized protein (DUF2236 family)
MSETHPDDAAFGFGRHVREALPAIVDSPEAPAGLGPHTLIWKFYGDLRVQLFGFQRLATTENAIEQLATAVDQHSVIFGDFLGRTRRTAIPVLNTVYDADPTAWGRKVRDFHRDIKGTMADGNRYHALNPELFYWAHATFIDQIIYCTDTFIRRLTPDEKEQIFQEGKRWYLLYGISARNQPQTYPEFEQYWADMLERFTATPTARYGTGYIRKGLPGPGAVPAALWKLLTAPINGYTRTMIAGTLPPNLREMCGLTWSPRRQQAFDAAAAFLRALDPIVSRLPVSLRYAPWAARGWKRTGTNPRLLHALPAQSHRPPCSCFEW